MQELADHLIELEIGEVISKDTVHRSHKTEKNALKPWLRQQWCLPEKQPAEFVYAIEDVLALYYRPFDPQHPLICFDEGSKQLVAVVRCPLPPQPRHLARYDFDYQRSSTLNSAFWKDSVSADEFRLMSIFTTGTGLISFSLPAGNCHELAIHNGGGSDQTP